MGRGGLRGPGGKGPVHGRRLFSTARISCRAAALLAARRPGPLLARGALGAQGAAGAPGPLAGGGAGVDPDLPRGELGPGQLGHAAARHTGHAETWAGARLRASLRAPRGGVSGAHRSSQAETWTGACSTTGGATTRGGLAGEGPPGDVETRMGASLPTSPRSVARGAPSHTGAVMYAGLDGHPASRGADPVAQDRRL